MRSISLILLLTSVSFCSFGQQQDHEIFLNRKYYALLFATDEYNEWQNLDNPIHDVNAIAKELKNYYGFEVEVIKNFNKEQVFLKLNEYQKKSFNPYDQLLIYFAGHGFFDERLEQGFLVCKDSKAEDKSRSSYINPKELSEAIDRIPTQHTLVILDACKESIARQEEVVTRRTARLNNAGKEDYIKDLLKHKTRKFITCGSIQYSEGQAGKHSPFTRSFIEAIRSYGGGDRLLPLSELYGYFLMLRIEPFAGSFGTNEAGSSFVLEAKY